MNQLRVSIFDTVERLAASAADDLAAILRQAIAEHGTTAAIFATGNSQLAFYQQLQSRDAIAWDRVTVFHMDEYLGLPAEHPAIFRHVIHEWLVAGVHPRAFYGIAGDAADIAVEMERYGDLLKAHRPIACVMGIGENGHLAFNDPPADFTTRRIMDVVTLVESCRQQQVGEGHFARLEDVPRQAISLTVPALLTPPHILVIAPKRARPQRCALHSKARSRRIARPPFYARRRTRLYLDHDSAALLGMRGYP
jgi:glucosamine-6-phosphate deaminase